MHDSLLVRLPKGEDLLAALVTICREQGITKGHISLIGALEKAVLGYYPQDTRQYVTHTLDTGTEILAGLGNVSLKDGEPAIHLHLTLLKATSPSPAAMPCPATSSSPAKPASPPSTALACTAASTPPPACPSGTGPGCRDEPAPSQQPPQEQHG